MGAPAMPAKSIKGIDSVNLTAFTILNIRAPAPVETVQARQSGIALALSQIDSPLGLINRRHSRIRRTTRSWIMLVYQQHYESGSSRARRRAKAILHAR